MNAIMNLVKNFDAAMMRIDKIKGILGIAITVKEFDGSILTLSVEQFAKKGLVMLTQKQLHERAKELFDSFEYHKKPVIRYHCITYNPDMSVVTPMYIVNKMKDIGLKQADVSKQLNIDKSTISLFLSGEKPLTKIHKSLFYFYFEYYENNIAFLEHLQLMEAENEAHGNDAAPVKIIVRTWHEAGSARSANSVDMENRVIAGKK